MTKKRKTRAQKERLTERRQANFAVSPKAAKAESPATPKTASKPVKASDREVESNFKAASGLKKSLIFLAIITAVQLLVWGYFRVSLVDESLFRLFKI